MRTQDPANIRSDFDASLDDVETAYNAAEVGVAGVPQKQLISEYLFVAAATLFEGFVSDLFVAYINRDSDRFRTHVLRNMSIEAADDYAKRSLDLVEKSLPHLSVDKIREILDPTGYNVTFQTTARMKEAAGKWLPQADSVKFTGASNQQCAVVDFVKAVRNYLAHRSNASMARMQEALVAADLPAELRRAGNRVRNVGAYLRSTHGPQRRFLHSVAQIRALAAQLCP